MQILKRIKSWKSKPSKLLSYDQWQQQNPAASFEDYYVYRVSNKLTQNDGNHPTLTLTKTIKTKENSGKSLFKLLKQNGMQPHHRVVDYGCGSLRVARHVIPYLNPNCFYGLDVTDQFYKAGIQLLSSTLIQDKHPQFNLTNSSLADDLQKRPPDYVYSIGVLIHIPPDQVHDFFNKINCYMNPTTTLILGTKVVRKSKTIQRNPLTWYHNKTDIESMFNQMSWQIEVLNTANLQQFKCEQRMFWKLKQKVT